MVGNIELPPNDCHNFSMVGYFQRKCTLIFRILDYLATKLESSLIESCLSYGILIWRYWRVSPSIDV